GPVALLWNKLARRQVKAVDLFVSKAAFAAAVRAPFCAALNRERSKRRGEKVDPRSGSDFDTCPDPADQVVILGSHGRRAFDRVGILMGPYVAGPYAEGDYEVTLPVTPAIIAAVRPQYRADFAPLR
ncbi:MAG TPA: hypothetical protein VN222_09605, partial [Novosphingobium sp.]|nr:hypothetical protein [Novosphingobium sp.]